MYCNKCMEIRGKLVESDEQDKLEIDNIFKRTEVFFEEKVQKFREKTTAENKS